VTCEILIGFFLFGYNTHTHRTKRGRRNQSHTTENGARSRFVAGIIQMQICKNNRDGSNQAGRDGSGCPNRNLAIQAGAKIPPSVNKTKALCEKDKDRNKKLTLFFGRTKKFDKKTLNQILMIWQTRNALPWSRIEDFELNAAFHYSQPDSLLHKRKWAANEAKQLYVSLQGAMLGHLKVSFLLQHLV
jgi:hypothetical protein